MSFLRTLVVLALCLFAAGAQAQESRLQDILKSGVLRVGTTGDWNPMTMKDPASGDYEGFDIDTMRELAKDLGVEVEFVPAEWKTIVAGILADKYDLSTSASVTPERIRTVGFTESYYQVGTVPLTKKDNAGSYASWDDINKEGVKVAVTLGTSHEKQAGLLFPKATLIKVEAPARDFQEVLSGRADVSITSNLEASKLIKAHDVLAVIEVDKPAFPADLAFIVPQDDQIWLNYLNHWIAIKSNHGFFDDNGAKWMGLE